MHACLGIVHPNPLQLLLPVCLSLSLLRLIYSISFPQPLSLLRALGPFSEMLTRGNPAPKNLGTPRPGPSQPSVEATGLPRPWVGPL